MNHIKQITGGIVLSLLEVVVGILLLVNPVKFTSGIITAAGVGLMLWGVVRIIKYFRMDAIEAAESHFLMKGLALLTLGGFCMLKSQWFLITFPLLTLVYGVVILLSGFEKVQWTLDMLRTKKPRWFLAAISAVVSIVCGIVILCTPFTSTAVLWMFTGISLICEAVLDMVAFVISGCRKKKVNETETAEDAGDDAR